MALTSSAIDALVGLIAAGGTSGLRRFADGSTLEFTASWLCRRAAEVLGRLGDPRAVRALIQYSYNFVEGSGSGDYRVEQDHRNGIKAIVQIGPTAIAPLIEILRDAGISNRHEAAEALGILGGPLAVEALTAALAYESDHVRGAALGALVQLRGPAVVEHVKAMLRDESEWVRRVATLSLPRIAGIDAVDDLILLLGDQEMGWAAIEALVEIGGSRAIQALEAFKSTLSADHSMMEKVNSALWRMTHTQDDCHKDNSMES